MVEEKLFPLIEVIATAANLHRKKSSIDIEIWHSLKLF